MKSGAQIAKENTAKLKSWLDSHSEEIPRLQDGRVNKSRLAEMVGLDRQVFVTNPGCKTILESLEGGVARAKPLVPPDLQKLIEARDRQISSLMAQVARREAELNGLREEVQRLRCADARFAHLIETGRRFPPPST